MSRQEIGEPSSSCFQSSQSDDGSMDDDQEPMELANSPSQFTEIESSESLSVVC